MNVRKVMNVRVAALGAALAALLVFSIPAVAAEFFRVERLEVAAEVVEREPVGIADTFAADRKRVYAFLEARDIPADTTVNFVWFHNHREVAAVALPLQQGYRWRTYSSVTVEGRRGEWRVELRDEAGQVRQALDFQVE